MAKKYTIRARYCGKNDLTLRNGNCLSFLRRLPDGVAQLVITSPPYNVGKAYERDQTLEEYKSFQRSVIKECIRITRDGGSICWQVGNYVDGRGRMIPLDVFFYPLFAENDELQLRNRVIWHFEHGLHCQTRFSGRHESVLWFTKGDKYFFNLDAVRVPQKYPGKLAYHGPNRGQPSGNPNGKNPGDVWAIPNVKGNHVEKTDHPCQFPIALAENFILALTRPRHLIVDPFLGAGTTAVAALKNGRRAAGAETCSNYVQIIRDRVKLLERDALPYRPRSRAIYAPPPNTPLTTPPPRFVGANGNRNGRQT